MEVTFALCLPRDGASVPTVRHLCTAALRRLGVDDDCCYDIELAVTEACTNVLKHSTSSDEYEVDITLDDRVCDIRVTDRGDPFEHDALRADHVDEIRESGRGVYLMRALVDELHFVAEPDAGMSVRLRKRLELEEGAMLGLLGEAARRTVERAR